MSSLNTESAKCPFCLQIVTIEYLNTILDEIKLRLQGYDDSLNQLNLQLDPLLNQLKTVEEIKHQSEIESQKLRTKLQVEEKAREKYNQLIFVRGRIEITIQAKEKELEVLRDTNKEYSTQENISPYEQSGRDTHDPTRPRRLLLHKREIGRLYTATAEKGLTLIPLRIYFKGPYVKIELATARGRKMYDKRERTAKQEADRAIERAVRRRNK